MKTFYIKQKVFTFKDSFTIYDENGDVYFTVKGNLGLIRKKLYVYDQSGRERFFLKQKLFCYYPAYLPTMFIYQENQYLGKVRTKFTFLKKNYVTNYKDWYMEGSFLGLDLKIHSKDSEVVEVHKKFMSFGDAYEIVVFDDNEADIALAIILGIDACVSLTTRN